MPDEHYLTTSDLRDSVTQRKLCTEIVELARKRSRLDTTDVVRTFWTPVLHGRIPVVSRNIRSTIDVDELQDIDITRPTYTHCDYDLKKISVRIGISDEALIEANGAPVHVQGRVISSWDWQRDDCINALADAADQLIARAIMHNPQHVVYNYASQSFTADVLPDVYRALAPYTPQTCVCSGAAASFIQEIIGGSPQSDPLFVPYTRIPIVTSEYMPGISPDGSTEIYFVSPDVPAVAYAALAEPADSADTLASYTRERIITRSSDSINGAFAIQIDTYRDIFGGIITTPTGTNKGVVCVHVTTRDPELAIIPDEADVANTESQSFEVIYQ